MIASLFGALLAVPSSGTAAAQVTTSQTIVIRTRVHGAKPAPPPPPAYREKRGPPCIEAGAIAGAAVMAADGVDFILKGGDRMRARLEAACPELDYYRGFYVSPNPDGRICAGRDAIRTRSGAECQIDRFRKLVTVAPKSSRPPAP